MFPFDHYWAVNWHLKRLPLILLWCKCQNLRNQSFIWAEIQWCISWTTFHLMLAVCPQFLFYVWLCSWMIWFVSCKARHWRMARLMRVLFPISLFKRIYFALVDHACVFIWRGGKGRRIGNKISNILENYIFFLAMFTSLVYFYSFMPNLNLIWLKLKQIMADCVLVTSTTVSNEAKKFVDVSI